jgi:hypothetical protein
MLPVTYNDAGRRRFLPAEQSRWDKEAAPALQIYAVSRRGFS